MNFVKPIRDKQVLREIRQYLKDTNERDYILFTFGIYTGMHIADILPLRIREVKGTHIENRGGKSGVNRQILVNEELRKELDTYISGKPDDDYLFKKTRKAEPVDRAEVYKMLQRSARRVGLETGSIGTETLRKTWGYHLYKESEEKMHILWALRKVFNHKNDLETIRYLEINNQEDMDQALEGFEL